MYLWTLLHECVCYECYFPVRPQQYCNLVLWYASGEQRIDGGQNLVKCLLLEVSQRIECYLHLAAVGASSLLLNVAVCLFQLTCHVSAGLPLCFGLFFHRHIEEGVVERHDVLGRAAVVLHRLDMQFPFLENALDVVQQSPVARAPSVDALLHVAHDEVLRHIGFVGVGTAHAVAQQHEEVSPLHGACVLKLVYHDVVHLCAYLLVYERRVAVLYKFRQQLLCVAEQESVGGGVHLCHLLLDGSQQAQLVDVGERHACGVVSWQSAPETVACLPVQRCEQPFGNVEQLGMFLLCSFQHPHCVVFERIVVGLALHVLDVVLAAVGEFPEEAAHGAVQAGGVDGVVVDNLFESRLVTCHQALEVGHYLVHAAAESLEALVVAHHLAYLFAFLLIHVLEDGLAERLYAACHVPTLVVGNVFGDEVDNPCQFAVFVRQFLNHLVNGHLLHVGVVESHSEVCRQSQFVGEVAQHALEELVYRLHLEVVEVVDEVGKRDACPASYLHGVHRQFLGHSLCVTLRVGQCAADAVELRHDALLHLLGCLVGECDGENALVGALWVLHHQFYVLHRQAECLAAACACVIYLQLHFSGLFVMNMGVG